MFSHQIGRNVEVYVDDMLVKSKEEANPLDDLKETFSTLHKCNMKLNPAKCVFAIALGKFLGFMVSQQGIEVNPDKVKAIIEVKSPKTVKEVQSLTGKVATLNRFVSRAMDNSIDTQINIPCSKPTSIRKKEIQKEAKKKNSVHLLQ